MRTLIRGMESVVRVLLDAGVPIESTDGVWYHDGDTALISAAMKSHSNIVRLLLDKGANVETKNQYGRSAILQALHIHHLQERRIKLQLETIKLLINTGANVNTKSENGMTPLHRAAMIENLRAVDLLLRAGADPLAQNMAGELPFDLARENDIKDRLEKALS